MAIYRLEAKIFSREKRGRSVVAAAAYRAGKKLKDEIKDKTYDYARRIKGVLHSTIVAPEGAPQWVFDSASLWNTVERSEKRIDAQLAREFVLALPKELPADAQFQVALAWAQKELVNSGMVAELSLHHPKSGQNYHVHILCPLRKIEGDAFGAKKPREWNDVRLLFKQRETWAEFVNSALEKAGREERVDHRSLKARKIDRAPEPKIGPVDMALKRRGIEADPERFKLVREVKLLNEVRPMMRAMQEHGEIKQHGNGANWWERSLVFMSRVRDDARDMVKGAWQRFVESRKTKDGGNEPERS